MKKTLALILCLMMALSTVSCALAQSAIPSFDTGWAGENYVMPVPAPPLADITIRETTGRISGGPAIDASGKDESLTQEAVEAYRKTLGDLGFVNDLRETTFDSPHGYEFSARNDRGDYIYLYYDAPYLWCVVELAMVEEAPAEEATDFDPAWAGDEYVMPIPLVPFSSYYVDFSESQNLFMISDTSVKEEWANYENLSAYCDTLKALGFTEIETDVLSEEAFQTELTTKGAATLFAASNAEGYRVQIYQEESTPMVWLYGPEKEEAAEPQKEAESAFQKIQLPDLEWICKEMEEPNGNKYLSHSAKNVPQDVVEAYVEDLKAAGYVQYDGSECDTDKSWYFRNEETYGSQIITYIFSGRLQIDTFGDF